MVCYYSVSMITVIIAGGSGTRLWPLSTHKHPKHLLSLHNEKSLLQNTVDRVSAVSGIENVFIIPETSHADRVRDQLPDHPADNIIVEPGRRGTASCVMLALSRLKGSYPDDEPVFFLWADHLIRDSDGFAATVAKASNIGVAEQKLVFIGVEPTYASTGFGYLERDAKLKGWPGAFTLKSFKEKPGKRVADRYFTSGKYYWNTGYLVGTIGVFEREMREAAPRLWKDYNALLKAGPKEVEKLYMSFESEAIDTALSEKITDGIVVPGTFDWADVGSFKDLHEISLQDDDGNHIMGGRIIADTTTNSYIRNEVDCPVAVIGLDNVVVVNTANGILVTNKNFAQNVGDVAKKLQEGS
jgi:mannose-1-phosphate guanylyltransferase